MYSDDSLAIPPNRNPSAGRASTPSKSAAVTLEVTSSGPIQGVRRITPSRKNTSAPRSSSGGKLAAAINSATRISMREADKQRSKSGRISRRKQRKWEMDNLFGLNRSLFANDDASKLNEFDFEDGLVNNFGLSVDWRCLFSDLFREKNDLALQKFLSCEDSVYQTPKYKDRFSKLSGDIKDGELSWSRIPNKLRLVVQRSVEQDEDLAEFGPSLYIKALESVIFYFVDTGYAPPVTMIPAALSERLELPIQIEKTESIASKAADSDEDWVIVAPEGVDEIESKTNKSTAESIDMSSILNIYLQDSPLHRLLLHAVVQFHGLQSKSTDAEKTNQAPKLLRQKGKKGKQSSSANGRNVSQNVVNRCISVSRGKKAANLQQNKSLLPKNRISLVSFLQYKSKQKRLQATQIVTTNISD